jgi:hypothetical protein
MRGQRPSRLRDMAPDLRSPNGVRTRVSTLRVSRADLVTSCWRGNRVDNLRIYVLVDTGRYPTVLDVMRDRCGITGRQRAATTLASVFNQDYRGKRVPRRAARVADRPGRDHHRDRVRAARPPLLGRGPGADWRHMLLEQRQTLALHIAKRRTRGLPLRRPPGPSPPSRSPDARDTCSRFDPFPPSAPGQP